MTDFRERRSSPRVKVLDRTLSVATTARARVLDISAGGVLAEGEVPERWAAISLTLPMQGGRFSSRIVRRHQSGSAIGLPRFGAEFTEMGVESRHSLEQFLAKAAR